MIFFQVIKFYPLKNADQIERKLCKHYEHLYFTIYGNFQLDFEYLGFSI